MKTDLKCVHSFQWKIIRFAKYKSSSYTNDLWISILCCDADCWFDLLRIYDIIVLDFMLCIYFSALIFSGNGNGHVMAGGKYGIIFIYWSKWCFQLCFGEEYEKMIFFPKHTNIITDMKSENITTTALKVHDDGLEIFHSCHCFASQILRFFSKPKFTYTILLLYYLIFCDFFFWKDRQ